MSESKRSAITDDIKNTYPHLALSNADSKIKEN